MPPQAEAARTADVFISYAREDRDFVEHLRRGLVERGRKVWVDLDGIFVGEEFWPRICAAIEEAQAFVFIITPYSVASDACRREIRHAVERNKRLLPVLHHEVADGELQPAIASVQWTFARPEEDLQQAVEVLLRALDTDPQWVRMHTRLLVRAVEWDQKSRRRSLVISGRELPEAERWLADRTKDPKPTELHADYIRASRTAARWRKRALAGALGILFVLAFFMMQYLRLSQADDLATQADKTRDTAPVLLRQSVAYAAESLQQHLTARGYSALAKTVDLMAGHPKIFTLGSQPPITAIAFSKDGQWLAAVAGDCTTRLIRLKDAADPIGIAQGNCASTKLPRPHGPPKSPAVAAFSADSRWLAVGCAQSVQVWDMARSGGRLSGASVVPATGATTIWSLSFNDDGSQLAVTGYGIRGVQINDLVDGSWRPVDRGDLRTEYSSVRAAIFSSKGRWLVVSDGRKLALQRLGKSLPGVVTLDAEANNLAFGPDSRFLYTGDPLPLVWEMEWSDAQPQAAKREVHSEPIKAPQGGFRADAVKPIAVSNDGRYLATVNRGERAEENTGARIWQLQTSNPNKPTEWAAVETTRVPYRTTALAFTSNSKWLATGHDNGVIALWPVPNQHAVAQHDLGVRVLSVSYSAKGRWLAALGSDHTVRVFDTASSKQLAEVRDDTTGKTTEVGAVAFAPVTGGESRWLIVGFDDRLHVVDTETWRSAFALRDVPDLRRIEFSPSGRWLIVEQRKGVSNYPSTKFRFLELGTWRELPATPVAAPTAAAVFDESENFMAVLANYDRHSQTPGFTKVWDSKTGEVVAWSQDNPGHSGAGKQPTEGTPQRGGDVSLLAQVSAWRTVKVGRDITGGGKLSATSLDGLWSATAVNGNVELHSLPASGFTRLLTMVLPSGLESGDTLRTLVHDEAVSDLAFSPDNRWLVTASSESVRIWPIQPEDLVADACAHVTNLPLPSDDVDLSHVCPKAISGRVVGSNGESVVECREVSATSR
jgi:WD40 repeat protein